MLKVIKTQSKETYKNKEGKQCHYYHYFIVCDNGKRIAVKACFKEDFVKLDMIAEYVS